MADQTLKATDQIGSATSHGMEQAANAARSVTDQALAAGRDLKDRAADLAGTSTETIKQQASEFVDAAKDVASQAGDKFKQTVDGQKTAGADYVGSLADTIRRAAKEFDGDLPVAGTYIRKAASGVDGVADTIRTGNFNDLVRGAQSFARRQPTAFLGMAVLAGFGVVRFLKSSANDAGSSTSRPATVSNAAADPVRWHDDSKGYRDEFLK
jgi:nucleotide-binding universal stress UspA family protein